MFFCVYAYARAIAFLHTLSPKPLVLGPGFLTRTLHRGLNVFVILITEHPGADNLKRPPDYFFSDMLRGGVVASGGECERGVVSFECVPPCVLPIRASVAGSTSSGGDTYFPGL